MDSSQSPRRRRPSASAPEDRPPRRQRLGHGKSLGTRTDPVCTLSSELMISVFRHLDTRELGECHKVSRRWRRLVSDASVWRHLYHRRFVGAESSYAEWSRSPRGRRACDWKREYCTRSNWQQGRCRVRQIEWPKVSNDATQQPLVCVQGQLIACVFGDLLQVRVDGDESCESEICELRLKRRAAGAPCSVSVSLRPSDREGCLRAEEADVYDIVVGFDDGNVLWCAWERHKGVYQITGNSATVEGKESTELTPDLISLCYPHVVTQARLTRSLCFYMLEPAPGSQEHQLRLLQIVSGHALANGPFALSVRRRPAEAESIVSLAFMQAQLVPQGAVCVQEWRVLADGRVLPYSRGPRPRTITPREAFPFDAAAQYRRRREPEATCIALCEPYVLTGHADNTIVVHELGRGSEGHTDAGEGACVSARLWGHTAGVKQVGIDGTGTAVTLAPGELRIWQIGSATSSRVHLGVKAPDAASASGQGGALTFDGRRIVVPEPSAAWLLSCQRHIATVFDFTSA